MVKVPDWALTAAAWVYLHWRNLAELVGLVLLVLAAALLAPTLGIAAAGVALLILATFAGRAH